MKGYQVIHREVVGGILESNWFYHSPHGYDTCQLSYPGKGVYFESQIFNLLMKERKKKRRREKKNGST